MTNSSSEGNRPQSRTVPSRTETSGHAMELDPDPSKRGKRRRLTLAMTRTVSLLLAVLLLGANAEERRILHVSVDGRPDQSGTVGQPLDSIAHARDLLRREHPANGAIMVVHGGTYFLSEPLRFTPEDTGSPTAPLAVEAAPGEHPVLSGGRRITNWKVAGGRWTTDLPEVQSGHWDFLDLYVGGQRRPRPRLPKNGWFKVAAALPPSGKLPRPASGPPAAGPDQFTFHAGDLHAWSNLHDVEVCVVQQWRMHRLRIAEVDETEKRVRFTGATGGADVSSEMPAGAAFLVENVREALTNPGEWYLDQASGQLTYLPLPGEDPAKTEIIAPFLESVLEINGTASHPVSDVSLKGLTFAHTRWTTPPEGHCFPQAEADVSAAVRFHYAQRCRLEQCGITLVGGYGIDLGEGTKSCRLEDCEINHLGAGGLRLGGDIRLGPPSEERDQAADNQVENCRFAQGGRIHPAAVGILIGHSPRNRIVHCDITDFFYTGISLGWSWGYAPSLARENHLEFCHIWKIGQQVLSDMGGIYTLGNGPGNVLQGNHIHDVACRPGGYGGWGLYHDEGSTGFLSEDNVVHHTSSSAFHQHYGRENVLRNNVFAFGREGGLTRTRAEDHLSFTFDRNIILTSGVPFLVGAWADGHYHLENNLYWDVENPQPKFPHGQTFVQWQAGGQDTHSRVSNPGAQEQDGGITFPEGPELAALGIHSVDFRKAGRRGSQRLPEAEFGSPWPAP